jgi:hypothetical protein
LPGGTGGTAFPAPTGGTALPGGTGGTAFPAPTGGTAFPPAPSASASGTGTSPTDHAATAVAAWTGSGVSTYVRAGSQDRTRWRSRCHQVSRSATGAGGSSTTTTTSGGGATRSPFHSRNFPQSPQNAELSSFWLPHIVQMII